MANEAKNKNEVTENAPEASLNNANSEHLFSFSNPFSSADDSDLKTIESEKLFLTNIPVYHNEVKSKNTGKNIHVLCTLVNHTININGESLIKEFLLNYSVKTSSRFGNQNLYDFLDIIFAGGKKFVFLEILRREFTIDDKKQIVWSPQISGVDDNGFEYIVPLSFKNDGDKALWKLLLSILAKSNVISGYSSI